MLVDTSVWIEVFKRRDPLDLEALVDLEEVVTCLPVVQEVLQGFREERAFRKAREAMFNLTLVESPLPEGVFVEAVELYRTGTALGRAGGKLKGLSLRSSVDCLVAACALRHDLEVWHRDRDYPSLARVSRLRQRRL